jgi:hypothetical protein
MEDSNSCIVSKINDGGTSEQEKENGTRQQLHTVVVA